MPEINVTLNISDSEMKTLTDLKYDDKYLPKWASIVLRLAIEAILEENDRKVFVSDILKSLGYKDAEISEIYKTEYNDKLAPAAETYLKERYEQKAIIAEEIIE